MSGRNEYKEMYRKRIENKINDNSDIMYLEDFYWYIAKKEPTTVYNYINYVINFMRSSNITDPHTITFSTYNRYTAKLVNETPSYQIAVYSALKKYSLFLSANNICDDYMRHVERPKSYEKQETKIRRESSVLTKDEISEVLINTKLSSTDDIWGQRDYAIIMLFASSGIRSAALYKLDVKDIDINNNKMIVTEKRDTVREIILPQKTIVEIEKWINLRSKLNVKTDALFVSSRKKRISPRSIYRIVNEYCSVNEKNGHPHILRSTYCTILYDESKDLYLTQTNMGHANPKTTELYIRGKDIDLKKKAAQIVDSFI